MWFVFLRARFLDKLCIALPLNMLKIWDTTETVYKVVCLGHKTPLCVPPRAAHEMNMIITFLTFWLAFGWNSLPLHYEIRTKCCCTTPSVSNVLSTTYVHKVWVQTSEQTYRQRTFIKFEYKQANKPIGPTSYSPRLLYFSLSLYWWLVVRRLRLVARSFLGGESPWWWGNR